MLNHIAHPTALSPVTHARYYAAFGLCCVLFSSCSAGGPQEQHGVQQGSGPPATNDGANGNPMHSTPGGGSVGGDSPATAGTGGTNGQDSANNSSTQGPTGELVVDGEIIVLGENSNVPVGCGNGVLTPDEACDDGNEQSGDGCDAECLQVEPGFSCAVPGQACREIARCGDGLVAATEQCDDGNAEPGDGCSERCRIERGSQCDGEPSVCVDAECGNGIVEGAESCDDGNTDPFDGCSSLCLQEPNCEGTACTSECGDGLVINEECDDGNNIDGDGCSATCEVETGFVCSQETTCERVNGECVLRVPTIFRDFPKSHPDFGSNCSALALGIVEDDLDEAGRPVLLNGQQACIQGEETFNQWFTDGDHAFTMVGNIVLFENESGGYVNRWGENGEKWTMWTREGGDGPDEQPINADIDCDVDVCHQCSWAPTDPTQICYGGSLVEYDGNPLFFPVDTVMGDTRDQGRAKVPAEYGYDGWPWEDEVFADAPLRNFYFTSEVQYWFRYDEDTNATLDFTGDDDVWVFINGKLAVDLGGVHTPEDGSVTIDAQSAAQFALEAGNVYRITVFHVERKEEGSSFKLTLSGFEATPSDCSAVCGDGILSFGEECDDGVNDGGYGECDVGCKLGPFCGDGIVQPPEHCDNGPGGGPGCAGCRVLQVR